MSLIDIFKTAEKLCGNGWEVQIYLNDISTEPSCLPISIHLYAQTT